MRVLGLALLVACGEPPPDEPVDPAALDDPNFWFCHEAAADRVSTEEWCDLLEGAPPDRCPGMRATCNGESMDEEVVPSGCNGLGGGGGAGEGILGGPDEPGDPVRVRRQTGCERETFDEQGQSQLLTWIGAILVALLVLVLFRVLSRSFGRGARRPAQVVVHPLPEDDDDALPEVPNLPSGDLLDAARAALANGQAGEAVLLARGAALRHLGDIAKLRLHRSRTDREYVRAMRSEPDAQQALREVVGAVEHHRWGGDPLGLDRARQALASAERLVGLLATAVLLFVLVGSLPAHAQVNRYAPYGDAALRQLLQQRGYEAGYRLRNLTDLNEDTHALVVDASKMHPSDVHWDAVRSWVQDGGVLILAGQALYRDDGFDSPVFPSLGEWTELDQPVAVRRGDPLSGTILPTPRWADGGCRAVYHGGPAWVETADDDAAAAVSVVDVGQGVVVGVADQRLLWNASFVHPDNEAFVGDLLYHGQARHGWPVPTPARVELATAAAALSPQEAGDNNPLAAMQNARLALFMAQLLVVWTLFGLWRGWPFAPLRDPPEEGRLDFAEHVQALGTRWYRLGASRHALVQMARLWLARLGTSGLELAARRTGMTPAQAAAWVAELELLVEHPAGPDAPTDLDRMEELWKVTQRPG